MSWAQRRKTTYIVSILFVEAIIVAVVLFFALKKVPTCFDGIQNEGEQGIDCGGPCQILCRAQYGDPVVIWGPRWEKIISNGTYSFLTYVQNPNIGAGAYNVPYTLKVYDKDNILLYQKNDTAYIPPDNNFVIFEDNINLGDKVPDRAELEFTQSPSWQKMTSQELQITPLSKNLTDEDTNPKLFVTMSNSGVNPIQNIQEVAILYDSNNNAVDFSTTKIDSIAGGGTSDIVFTWPEPFAEPIVRIDIVSTVLPD
jgi:hypothetical protein